MLPGFKLDLEENTMKRVLALALSVIMLLCVLTGCQSAAPAETTVTTVPAATQSPEEQEVLKVLTIGNSHSLDATRMLFEVFQKEAPEQKIVLGTLYYSGCNMAQHAKFSAEDSPVYEYHKNENGNWQLMKEATVKMGLMDEQWDVVIMQQMNHRVGIDDNYVAKDYQDVIDYIGSYVKEPYSLAFHITWTNPSDYALYLNDDAPLNNPDPQAWRTQHEEWYGGADGKYDQNQMYLKVVEKVHKYLIDTTEFLGENYYDMMISSLTAVEYAQDVCGLTQEQVYRDYTHLNDFGRLLVGYLWYAQLMGLEKIDTVKVDALPVNLHHQNSLFPAMPDYTITQELKDVITQSVNWTLAHPYELPAK